MALEGGITSYRKLCYKPRAKSKKFAKTLTKVVSCCSVPQGTVLDRYDSMTSILMI